jgi:hypothetical protein
VYSVSPAVDDVVDHVQDKLAKSHGPKPKRRVFPTSKDRGTESPGQSQGERDKEMLAQSSKNLVPYNTIAHVGDLLVDVKEMLRNPESRSTVIEEFQSLDAYAKTGSRETYYKDLEDVETAILDLFATIGESYKGPKGEDLVTVIEKWRNTRDLNEEISQIRQMLDRELKAIDAAEARAKAARESAVLCPLSS